MDRKDDSELSDLLREWTAPETPRALESRVLRPARSWWRVLLFGYLRVPVPVACGLAVAMAFGAWRLSHPAPAGCTAEATPPVVLHAGCAPNSRC